ncbi:MAG: hypothetical protein EA391_14570 [Balneolaceae bacterium]|nr:MAG: hypothetical protein EA391_14570 [Balneolaceae bacterium]
MQNSVISKDVLVSGKTSFKIEVPYKLIETGQKGVQKPLILYFHGFGDNLKGFEETMEPLLSLSAYHLFIQGPYPIYDKKGSKTVSKWGRAWYLYDGKRKQFIKSLEITSEFVQEIIDNLIKFINVSRICVIGYSMGGYLAGYFGLTRWKHVKDVVVIGARIKTEVVHEESWAKLRHLNFLAIHGINDDNVSYKKQEQEIEALKRYGVQADIILLEEEHTLSEQYLSTTINWLKENNYR